MIAAPRGEKAPRTGGRLAVIDGLRLVAALYVASYHYTGFLPGVTEAWGVRPETAFPDFRHIGQYGFLGVELFFMISGFVICMSTWGRSTGTFFRSRIIRLFPAYWAAVLISTAVVFLWPVVRETRHWSDVLVNMSMMQAAIGAPHVDGVYWTLWNEALFYLLFSFMVWRGLTLRRTIVFGYAWLIVSMLSVRSGIPVLKVFLQADYAPFFVAGIALYLIYRFGPDLVLWGLLGFSFILAQYWTVQKVERVGKTLLDTDLSRVVGFGLVTLFFVILTVIALGYTSNIQWGWLTTAGLLTYPFYLLHENIGWTMIHQLRDSAPRVVIVGVVVTTMLIAAYLLHRLVEKPLARIMRDKLAEAAAGMNRPERFGRPAEIRPAESKQAESKQAQNHLAAEPLPVAMTIPAQRLPAESLSTADTVVLPLVRASDN